MRARRKRVRKHKEEPLRLIEIERLSKWFGGSSTVSYKKLYNQWTIVIKNDDLVNDFVFCFTEDEIKKYGQKEVCVCMLDKYLKQMEIERFLLSRKVKGWNNDKGGKDCRVCS